MRGAARAVLLAAAEAAVDAAGGSAGSSAGGTAGAAAASAVPVSSPFGLASVASALLHADEAITGLVEQSSRLAYAAVFSIVFVETGVVVLPFLPGDSLLFAAGALAGAGALSMPVLLAGVSAAAIAGDSVNYAVGHRLGREALRRGMVRAEHVSRAEAFFDRHGVRAVALARFVPIVRTVVPFLAGVSSVSWGEFCFWNVLGGLVWAAAFLGAGAAFGAVPAVKEHMGLFTVLVALASLAPLALESLRRSRAGRKPRLAGPGLLLPISERAPYAFGKSAPFGT